jgi:hypothetical protein
MGLHNYNTLDNVVDLSLWKKQKLSPALETETSLRPILQTMEDNAKREEERTEVRSKNNLSVLQSYRIKK